MTKNSVARLKARAGLLVVSCCLFASGCITPLSPEQQSDWRWKQQNPEYRLPYPPRE